MFNSDLVSDDQNKNRAMLLEVLPHYISKDEHMISVLSNVSSLIHVFFDRINWVGFYIRKGNTLYLGPFQGKPACTKINIGMGVCGQSALLKKSLIVDDVSLFIGHITCDSDSQSEIVVPIIKDNQVVGVIDVDSPFKNRFVEEDLAALETVAKLLVDIVW